MRYTEARLEKVTQEAFLSDLDKNVVDFVPNFDETEKEPAVLPVKIPNILVNGSEGIAVGMVTSIPPHNLSEVIDGVKAYMRDPDINTEQMMQYRFHDNDDRKAAVEEYIEFYNEERIHSSLGYKTPREVFTRNHFQVVTNNSES